MCLNNISPCVRVRASVCRVCVVGWRLRGGGQTTGRKVESWSLKKSCGFFLVCFFVFRDKSWRATRFPPCVDDLWCPDSVVLTCMPVLILSYQSDVFGICTQLSHSTQCKTGTCLLHCRWIWVFLDVYNLQSSFSLYSLIHTCKSWSHRYGYIYIILYFRIWRFLLWILFFY